MPDRPPELLDRLSERSLLDPADRGRDQHQHHAAAQRQEELAAGDAETQVAGQLAEAVAAHPVAEAVEDQQADEEDEQQAHRRPAQSMCERSPAWKPIGSSSQPRESAITLNSSPISCSLTSFCALARSPTLAAASRSTSPQLIRKRACEV